MTSDSSDLKSRDAIRARLQRELAGPEMQCVPPAIPDHELLQRIGTGAYGDVWLARNALGTLRAVKIVYRARFDEDRPYEREFKGILKYEPISRTHEGLVQVLHVGRNEEKGCFYYVMELADNAEAPNYSPRTLGSELGRRQRFSPVEAAQLALRLAGAVGHLHDQGLIHRDIKPGNVIFVNGLPKLADIGLITGVGDSRSFVGTEGFIPPEGPGSPQADLYGLGKVLYELATGRDRMDFPQLPIGFEALLELNEVMTRACAPEPQDRYTSAAEFQADLNLFLAGRSLRRARNIERHLRHLKRFAVAASVIVIVAVAAFWFEARQEQRARETARIQSKLRERAEVAEQQSRAQLYTALYEQARATVRSGEMGQRVKALDALRRAAAISNSVELRREVIAALGLPDLRQEREWLTTPETTGGVGDAKFDRIAFLRGPGAVEIRRVADDALLATLPASTNQPAHVARWSSDGRFLAIKRDLEGSGRTSDLEVWDMTGPRLAMLVRNMRWSAFAFHPRRAQLLTAGIDGVLSLWDLQSGNELRRKQFGAIVYHLAYSPEGDRVAASSAIGNSFVASIHTAEDGAEIWSQTFAKHVATLAWHPSGRWVATADLGGMIQLWDTQTREMRALGRHKAEAVFAAFNLGYLITGGWERELVCWDFQASQRAFRIGLNSFTAQFSRDGERCSVTTRTALQLHAFESPAPRQFAEDLGQRLRHAAFSPDGRWLAASGDDRLALWDLSGSAPAALAQDGAEARPFFTTESTDLFGSGNNNGLHWRIVAGEDPGVPPKLQRIDLKKPAGFTSLCVLSNTAVMTGEQGTQIGSSMRPTYSGITGVSPDGRWFGVYRPFASSLYVYRLPEMERVAKLNHPASIARFKFSPNGDEVAVASRGCVELWSTTTWQRTRSLPKFSNVIYTSDPRVLWLSTDGYRSTGLYDAQSLKPFLLLPEGMLALALSADGRQLAVSVDARRLQVWDLVKIREHLRELGLDWNVSR